jgi:hypothetical protein
MSGSDAAVTLPSYSTMEGAPGLRFFRCTALRATLSTAGCERNFLRAQSSLVQAGDWNPCLDCPLGALHAGVEFKPRSKLYHKDICCRCRRHSIRLIHGIACPSCYNRMLELEKGRNAKGTMPTCRPLEAHRIAATIAGQPVEFRAMARDTVELIIAVMRFAEGRLRFCRPRRGPAVDLKDWIAERRVLGGMNGWRASEKLRALERAIEGRRAQLVDAPLAAVPVLAAE